MMLSRRTVLIGLVGVGLAGVLVWACLPASTRTYLGYRVFPDYPQVADSRESLPGLSEPVRVRYEANGIPHIRAETETDLLRAVGYVQGRDRFFQMDLTRRLARGRLTELFGERALPRDRIMRGWGFERLALEAAESLSAERRRGLEAFRDGVNAAMEAHPPFEHRLLGLEPEPWTVADTFAVGLLNAWTITGNWQQELARLLLARSVGLERAERIYPGSPWKGGTSLPPETSSPHTLPPHARPELFPLFPPRPWTEPTDDAEDGTEAAAPEGGSNAWVLAGSRTESGAPLLANDPHLPHTLPSVFFQQHLQTPELNVIGVTLPGIPYVLAGHNEDVAWGTTAAMADAVDLVIERRDPDDPGAIIGPRDVHALETRKETFRIRTGSDWKTETATFRYSPNGPILNDIHPTLLPGDAPLVAVRWKFESFDRAFDHLRAANRATTIAELRAGLGRLPTPVAVWQAADRSGRIGLFLSGSVPVRMGFRGTFPVPGWVEECRLVGSYANTALPSGFEPGDGILAHANNLLRSPERSMVDAHIDTAPSYRYERIRALLETRPRHNVESLTALQTDRHLGRAETLLPLILDDLKEETWEDREETALGHLTDWTFEADPDEVGPALFFALYRQAIRSALDDELSGPALTFFLNHTYAAGCFDRWFRDPAHPVWDHRGTERVETRRLVIRNAFRAAIAELSERTGSDDPAAWQWGRVHRLRLRHPFGKREQLAPLVNLKEHGAGGGLDSIWKSHFELGDPDPYRTVAGPAVRMVMDLEDWDRSRWILNTGASGWPGSPNYGNQHQLWQKGKTIPMLFSREKVDAETAGTLILK